EAGGGGGGRWRGAARAAGGGVEGEGGAGGGGAGGAPGGRGAPPAGGGGPGRPPMRVLIVGGGGREHALAWKLAQSPRLSALYAAPGNPGIARHATCLPIRADAIDELVRFAEAERIDLTVVGPEAPLVAGIVDRFESRGLRIFGPSRAASMIEGSKAFAKGLMAKHGVPTARFDTFTDAAQARAYCRV